MKAELKKKLIIECTLDSSEAIMFQEGGKHKIILNRVEDPFIFNREWDEIEVSFQIEGGMMNRHKFIKEEAEKHKYSDLNIPPVGKL